MEITKERYDELLEAELMMNALEAAGVDNWDGYSEAMKIRKQDENEETYDDIYGE